MTVTTTPERQQRDVSASADASFEIRRLTLDEYHRLIALDFFPPTERIELIEGVLHRMTPRGPRHALCLKQLLRVFVAQMGQKVTDGKIALNVQDPIMIPEDGSEPEPDFALVSFPYEGAHPTPDEVLLIVEIADTSLNADRDVKVPLYAGAGITDYWIVNLIDDQIEVYREPVTLGDDGPTYRQRTLYGAGDTVAPLHFPNCSIGAGDVLPPRQTNDD